MPPQEGQRPRILWPWRPAAGAGVTLIAYEKHPATADVPIKIGFRLLRAAP